MKTLRESQVAALTSLLSLNAGGAQQGGVPTWKVLIMDKVGQDIVATSLRVQDLRAQGVTLHLQLHAPRPPLPDVPAIYFVTPTADNIQRIALDLQQGLYAQSYVNFTSQLDRQLLQDFAAQIAQDGTVEGVEQVFDQHLDFLVLAPALFSLAPEFGIPEKDRTTYEKLNDPRANEQDIEQVTDRVAKGLFSVLVTLGQSCSTVPTWRHTADPTSRSITADSSSSRKCCRNGCEETGRQAARSRRQLAEWQSLLFWIRWSLWTTSSVSILTFSN